MSNFDTQLVDYVRNLLAKEGHVAARHYIDNQMYRCINRDEWENVCACLECKAIVYIKEERYIDATETMEKIDYYLSKVTDEKARDKLFYYYNNRKMDMIGIAVVNTAAAQVTK